MSHSKSDVNHDSQTPSSTSNLDSSDSSYAGILFKIEKEGMLKPSYLFGTCHLPIKAILDFYPEFSDAFMKADNVVVEVNPFEEKDYSFRSGLQRFSQIMFERIESNFYAGSEELEVYNHFRIGVEDGSVEAMFNSINYMEPDNLIDLNKVDLISVLAVLMNLVPNFKDEDHIHNVCPQIDSSNVKIIKSNKKIDKESLDEIIINCALERGKKVMGLEHGERISSAFDMAYVAMLPYLYTYSVVFKKNLNPTVVEQHQKYMNIIRSCSSSPQEIIAKLANTLNQNEEETQLQEQNEMESFGENLESETDVQLLEPNVNTNETLDYSKDFFVNQYIQQRIPDVLFALLESEPGVTVLHALESVKGPIFERNQAWIPKIIDVLESDNSNFIAVGFLHLGRLASDNNLQNQPYYSNVKEITDKYGNGLIDMLKQKGYTVTPISVPHIDDHKKLYRSVMKELLDKTPITPPVIFSQTQTIPSSPIEDNENSQKIKP